MYTINQTFRHFFVNCYPMLIMHTLILYCRLKLTIPLFLLHKYSTHLVDKYRTIQVSDELSNFYSWGYYSNSNFACPTTRLIIQIFVEYRFLFKTYFN